MIFAWQSKLSLLTPHLDGLGFVTTAEAVDDDKAFIKSYCQRKGARGAAFDWTHFG